MDTTFRPSAIPSFASRLRSTLQTALAAWERRRRVAATAAVSRRLAPRHVTHLDLPAGSRLCVDSGRLWVTAAGELDDHFIGAGCSHGVPRRTRVVVECDSTDDAVFRVVAAMR